MLSMRALTSTATELVDRRANSLARNPHVLPAARPEQVISRQSRSHCCVAWELSDKAEMLTPKSLFTGGARMALEVPHQDWGTFLEEFEGKSR